MTRMEETQGLRARTDVHFNCCQSVLVPFADACGLDRDTAFQLGANFGRGMRRGSACGAVTSALMVLGLAGLTAGLISYVRCRRQMGRLEEMMADFLAEGKAFRAKAGAKPAGCGKRPIR